MDHTSGGQRAAEAEVTDEQRAEWERRLRARADELTPLLRDLAVAAAVHNSGVGDRIMRGARAAYREMHAVGQDLDNGSAARDAHAGSPLVTSRDAPPPGATLVHGHGDRPPFAEDLVADRPPHER